jgi:hypothetical protein
VARKPKKEEIIRIGHSAAEQVKIGLRQAEQFNIYLSGIRHALNVPDEWAFDPQQMAFVPRKESPE